MIRYFWPSDDEQLAGQWQDSHFDEDAGFLQSVLQFGANLALAAALLIGATTTQAAQQVFSQHQDDPAGSLSLQLGHNEDYWTNPVLTSNAQPTPPLVFTDDDVHPTFVQVFTPDDGDYWHSLVQPVADSNYIKLPFLDPEEIPAGSFQPVPNPVDDSSVWAPQLPPWDLNWTLLFFLDDGSAVPFFQYDEDFWVSGVPPQLWPTANQPITANDEDNFINAFVAEEQFWINPVAPVARELRLLQPYILDQDESATLVGFVDEIYWQNATQPVADSLLWSQQWAFEQNDATGSLSIGLDELFWVNPVAPDPGGLLWPQPFAFDESEVFPSAPFADEAYWQNGVAALPAELIWPQQFKFEQTDATGSLAIVIDELYSPTLVQPVPSVLGAFYQWQQVQDDPAGSLYTLLDEYYWQNPVAPVNWPQPSLPNLDEVRETFVGAFQPDEDFWTPQIPALWRVLYRPLPFVQEDDIPVLSAGPSVASVVPANGSINVAATVQIIMTFNKAIALGSVGASTLPITINGLQVAGTYHTAGAIVTFNASSPYAASSLVGISVTSGVLDTFGNPAVAFTSSFTIGAPCRPPAGFDGDTSITYFGGSKPTQVLFCRICNSAKPLLVRGDYAIWCQDCCAFVSKQDTYMGTVKAPGKFRGTF